MGNSNSGNFEDSKNSSTEEATEEANVGECCPPGVDNSEPPGSASSLGEKAPLKGSEVTLTADGVADNPGLEFKCYVVKPSLEVEKSRDAKTKVIIVAHDIFGYDSARTHHIADQLANSPEGYTVICPDFFTKEEYQGLRNENDLYSKPLVYTKMIWKRGRISWDNDIKPVFDAVMKYIRETLEVGDDPSSVGMLGFCWGGWANFKASATGQIGCAAGCHPSPHIEKLQFGSMEKLVHNIKCPQLLLPAWIDPSDLRADGWMMKHFQEKFKAVGSPDGDVLERSNSFLYESQKHGFVNRGDLNNPAIRAAYDNAMEKILEFFKLNLVTNPFVPAA